MSSAYVETALYISVFVGAPVLGPWALGQGINKLSTSRWFKNAGKKALAAKAQIQAQDTSAAPLRQEAPDSPFVEAHDDSVPGMEIPMANMMPEEPHAAAPQQTSPAMQAAQQGDLFAEQAEDNPFNGLPKPVLDI